jgi:dihydrofolate reductase
VTYEGWSTYWPTATYEPFASFINNVPKVVVSTTLKQVGWGSFDNAKLIKGSLAEGIARLKEQSGRTIGVNGSPSLVRSLLAQDLLDELYLQVHPVLGGKGQRLFSDDSDVKRLKLLENKTNSKGVAMLHYQARGI